MCIGYKFQTKMIIRNAGITSLDEVALDQMTILTTQKQRHAPGKINPRTKEGTLYLFFSPQQLTQDRGSVSFSPVNLNQKICKIMR